MSLQLADRRVAESVLDIAVTLVGQDGTAVGITGLNTPAELPIGEYRVNTLVMGLRDPKGGSRWNFVFYEDRTVGERRSYAVMANQSITLDPIGELRLTADVEPKPIECQPGDTLTVRPRLHTGDGLLINTSYWGATNTYFEAQPKAEVVLRTTAGDRLDSYQSGFF